VDEIQGITLKAFANLSPGFTLKPWVKKKAHLFHRNSEGVATGLRFGGRRRNPFRVASQKNSDAFSPGFKANPGLELANAFSVTLLIKGTRLQPNF
jgi:hypothetical protein